MASKEDQKLKKGSGAKLTAKEGGGAEKDTGGILMPDDLDLFGGDMVCLDCKWTLFTGGMDESAHESLGHRPLVKK